MTTQELVGTDVEIINALDFEPELACESDTERTAGVAAHSAEWMLTFSCGCDRMVCGNSKNYAIRIQGEQASGEITVRCSSCGKLFIELVSIIPVRRKK